MTNSIGVEFVLIRAGEFQMGARDGDQDEQPVRTVRISQPFYLGKYEVTQAQWQAVMGNNPSAFTGDPARPVENVSWEDVQEFIRRLHRKEGGATYRLPTEAEWEYAARAGVHVWYDGRGDAGSLRRQHDWPCATCQLPGSQTGLFCQVSLPGVTTVSGSNRVMRGGSWNNDASNCRSAYRNNATPGNRNDNLGFRLLST